MSRAKTRAPVKGASRCYVLTPSSEEDAYAWAACRLTERGWTPIDQGWAIPDQHGTWIMVELWAIPPRAE